MNQHNTALWLRTPDGPFEVGPAEYTSPGPGEIVVRVRAVAVNPIDVITGPLLQQILPWLTYPAVVGSDVAGEVVEVGQGVSRFAHADRVVGGAMGIEQSQNRPAEGAFQHYVVLKPHMVSPIPDDLSFQQAAVLPMGLSTAATGLFQQDHLGLTMPSVEPFDKGEAVLVWGGSTSLGSNAIQLARAGGYEVIATASPRNFDYVRSLGASAAFDYNSPGAVDEIVEWIGDRELAGTLAIGHQSVEAGIAIASRTSGSKRVASVMPSPTTQHGDVSVSGIWGGSLKDNEVGPGIYVEFLPAALANGSYRAAPPATIVGEGLARIPDAFQRLMAGVSAAKLVVTL
ncbi:zinc-binding alcohol dehydrogenase family protein [Mycobacterium ahvazicum]|uniref:zinc-binding alcohol dehydrogenase family protein n=1 Tax=Mycobacterium ahvazicum TaxID=1964395 RepID=UPI001A9C9DC4|nr:zinc-binding alcohol dehydrogenase family protein [Mycobacterium ahvazicum]